MSRAESRLALGALAGVLFGFGLGLGTNVSGVVLAFYGLVLGLLLAVLFVKVSQGTR